MERRGLGWWVVLRGSWAQAVAAQGLGRARTRLGASLEPHPEAAHPSWHRRADAPILARASLAHAATTTRRGACGRRLQALRASAPAPIELRDGAQGQLWDSFLLL